MAGTEAGRFYARVFALVAAALLALLLLNILKPFFESILWAALLAFLLTPVDDFLARRLGGRPALAALLLTLAGALFVLIPAVVTAVIFAGQATALIGRLRELADRYRGAVAARMRTTAKAAGLDPAYPAMHAHNAMCGLHACRPWREVDYSLVRKVLWLDRDVQWRASDVLNRWVERTWPAVVEAMQRPRS